MALKPRHVFIVRLRWIGQLRKPQLSSGLGGVTVCGHDPKASWRAQPWRDELLVVVVDGNQVVRGGPGGPGGSRVNTSRKTLVASTA